MLKNIKLKILICLILLSNVLYGTVDITVANNITKQLYNYTVEDGMYIGPWWKSIASPEAADSVQIVALDKHLADGYKWTIFPYLIELYILLGCAILVIFGFILSKKNI